MNRGFVKVWRKTLDSGLLQNPTASQVFLYLLMKASHKKHELLLGNKVIVLEKGQVITGRNKIMSDLHVSEMKTRCALDVLQNLGIISIKTSNKYSIISFVKWDTYQTESPTNIQQDNQQISSSLSNRYPTNIQQISTNKNEEERKEWKEINNPPLTPQRGESGARSSEAVSWSKAAGKSTAPTIAQQIAQYTQDARLGGALAAYVEMRKKIKKPLTDHAMSLALKKLDELGGVDVEYKAKVVEQSVLNSWQGLFEIKGEEPLTAEDIRNFEEIDRQCKREQQIKIILQNELGRKINLVCLSREEDRRYEEIDKEWSDEQLDEYFVKTGQSWDLGFTPRSVQ